MKAIIFAQVSTEEQKKEGFSLPAQIIKMREYCTRKGIAIKTEYEVDESSTKDERIIDDEYDRFYQSFREQLSDIDARLALLQEAEDNYYVTAKYILDLANRAYDLFIISELEEKRQLIKLVLKNLKLEGKTVQFEAIKPFDTLLSYQDYLPMLPRQDSNL